MSDREFDVVLYGASGFTGRQTVAYFATHAPQGVRWAIAGRNPVKLEALRADLPVIVAGSDDVAALDALASRTRVVLSTAGPFELYSDGLVTACVRQRTHYVDITGETVWVRGLIDRHHERAASEGTRIIPCCGFDCVPCDLGADWMFRQSGPETIELKAYFQVQGGSPNGGTMATALRSWETGAVRKMREPFLLNAVIERGPKAMEIDPAGAQFDGDVGAWVAPWIMGVIDTRVVRRSNSLLGRDFAYQEYTKFSGSWARSKAMAFSLFSKAGESAMRFAVFRELIKKKLAPGTGPSEEAMNKGWLRCEFIAKTSDGRITRGKLTAGGDPANRITVMCVCESALSLACDFENLPQLAGVLTPASGLGEALLKRLQTREFRLTRLKD